MDTLSELDTALVSDLNISSNSSLYPIATRYLALNRAYQKIGAFFKWPALEDSKKTSSEADVDYYDAPTIWRPDSIWRLEVDGVMYGEDGTGAPMAFEDYIIWKADNPNSTLKKWTVQWLRYFISPTPSTNGVNNISIWGQENVATLANPTDTTIFSYNMPECNDAIVLEAGAILKKKGEDYKPGQMLSQEALQIIITSFSKIKKAQAKYRKIKPFFDVPDYFARTSSKSTVIGNF